MLPCGHIADRKSGPNIESERHAFARGPGQAEATTATAGAAVSFVFPDPSGTPRKVRSYLPGSLPLQGTGSDSRPERDTPQRVQAELSFSICGRHHFDDRKFYLEGGNALGRRSLSQCDCFHASFTVAVPPSLGRAPHAPQRGP